MRIKLKFYSEGPLVIPVQYNHAVQSLIYNEDVSFDHEFDIKIIGKAKEILQELNARVK
jgi:CRISPR/Cas system endoribonuclease Cas6 (RAMP superfamily)